MQINRTKEMNMNDITEKTYEMINDIYHNLKTNNFTSLGRPELKMYDAPLIGVAAGYDAYFSFLKEHIGSFHWSPSEVFEIKYGKQHDPAKLRVISIIFPQAEATMRMQSKEYKYPSVLWSAARGEWSNVVSEFCVTLERSFNDLQIRSAAIDLCDEFSRMHSETQGESSKWSHRHAAFAAGLGTFGLSDGFISEKGVAIRITSIIAEADLDVTEREYEGHYDWCLYYKSGICGSCIRRCPARAISEKGHDKEKCIAYLKECKANAAPSIKEKNYDEVGCGLCQSKVPCMNSRP